MILIIICHWGPFFPKGSFADIVMTEVIPSGEFAFALFFVISGYLITTILLNARAKSERDGTTKSSVIKSFFARRVLRIFPVYYLTLAVLYIVGHPYLREHLWYYIFYMGNILPFLENKVNPLVHFWSLAVEEQFYLILPWVVIFVNKKYLRNIFLASIAVAIISKYIILFVMHRSFTMLVVNWFDAFGVGALYALVRSEGETNYKSFDKKYLLALVVLMYIGWHLAPISGTPMVLMYTRFMDIILALACIIFVLNNRSKFISKYLLENRFLNLIGRISYGLYVYHYVMEPPIQNFMDNYLSDHKNLPTFCYNFYFTYTLKYVVVFTASVVSYYAMELPLLQLKNKFSYNK